MRSRAPASVFLTTFFATGLLACSCATSPAIPGDALAHELASGTGPVVLDVRSDSEYAAGHVPGAIHIPFQSVASRVDELPVDKDETVVVYCAHGPRAAWAGRSLRNAGFTDVVYLEGHMGDWAESGRPLETSATTSAD